MRVPRCIESAVLGRDGFSETTEQGEGTGWAVPFVRQRHCNMCGDACIQMLSLYYQWGINIDMTTNPRGATDGLDIPGSAYAGRFERQRGITTALALVNAMQRYGPLMISGQYAIMGMLGDQGHWVVAKGYSDASIFIHDPWHGANVARDRDWIIDRIDTVWRPIP